MTERATIEQTLASLTLSIAWPDGDVSQEVMREIAELPAPVGIPGHRRRWSVLAAAAALVIAIAGGILVASPAARRAVADLLGIGGITVEYGNEESASPTRELRLGTEVDLEEAKARVGYPLAHAPALGSYSSIFIDDRIPGGAVTLVYPVSERVPRSGSKGVGALLTQFEASVERSFIHKLVSSGTTVERVPVDGVEGYWIDRPHTVLVLGADDVIEDQARLSAPTLLWERDGITYRLESKLGKTAAIEAARSVTAGNL